jgi:ubiquitin conjugation factor E4 B
MLNYFLDQLAGPKCLNLKVNQPEKYGFKPRSLLRKISGVYIHLAAHSTRTQEFADAVARDGRSYHDAVFAKAAAVLRKDSLLPEVTCLPSCPLGIRGTVRTARRFNAPSNHNAHTTRTQDEVAKFEAFAALARESAERANEAEENLGEIPDEFLGTIDRSLAGLLACNTLLTCPRCNRPHFADADDRSGHPPDVGQHHGPIRHLAPPPLHPVRSLQP